MKSGQKSGQEKTKNIKQSMNFNLLSNFIVSFKSFNIFRKHAVEISRLSSIMQVVIVVKIVKLNKIDISVSSFKLKFYCQNLKYDHAS